MSVWGQGKGAIIINFKNKVGKIKWIYVHGKLIIFLFFSFDNEPIKVLFCKNNRNIVLSENNSNLFSHQIYLNATKTYFSDIYGKYWQTYSDFKKLSYSERMKQYRPRILKSSIFFYHLAFAFDIKMTTSCDCIDTPETSYVMS